MSSATLRTLTLGCKVNQYETEYVRQGLLGIGFRDAQEHEPADLCIVNTCTVTAEADAKSRQAVRRLARRNPGARIVVMGCYATRAPEELASIPGVTEVVQDKRELPDLLGRFGVIDIPTGISGFGNRHRAYVKVQDGCLLRCSYCIIPKVRPSMHSRPLDDILAEVGRLFENGYREIVLTGIHLGHYGVDWNRGRPKSEWIRLSHLLRRIVRLEGDFRIRLSSIEATEVTRELISVMAEYPQKVCPHLHICLQSGADSVLRRMNRRWGVKRFMGRCQLAQEMLDQPALTTDVIVGFPGESDDEFAETCRVVQACGFSKVHIFPFSARRDTPAARLPGQLPKHVKAARRNVLAGIAQQCRQRYFRSLRGKQIRVLIESRVDGQFDQVLGTACRYAPVQLSGADDAAGQFATVRVGHVENDRIIAVT